MGIAIASGVPVAAGLITGIVGGIVVGSLSGSPLQVTGPAAGLTVIVFEIVQRFGLESLGLIVLIAGLFQVDSLRNPTVVKDPSASREFTVQPRNLSEAIKRAFDLFYRWSANQFPTIRGVS